MSDPGWMIWDNVRGDLVWILSVMDVIKDGTVRIVISIHRRILSLFLTTFLPTMLLPVMGHVTNYFNDSFFEGKMAVNVTVMLMLTTMFLRYKL